ncbi:hypothetical protein GCM10028857_03520 [Salinarchaeum chitinilyticum]
MPSEPKIKSVSLESEQDICVDIAEAIAQARGEPMDEIGPLEETIDSNAARNLFQGNSIPNSASFEFPFEGHWVTIKGSGKIIVEEM